MITHIRMKNFKSWKDSGEVKLAPLTGFFGTNSSGKSSLLQMLLLLKQTIGTDEILFFGNENSLVNLGDFSEVIHGHNMDATLELECGCQLRKPLPIDLSVYVEEPWEPTIDHFLFSTIVKEENGKPSVQNLRYIDIGGVWEIRWKSSKIKNIGSQFINRTSKGAVVVKNCYGSPVTQEERSKPRLLLDEGDLHFLTQISSVFEKLFSHVYYLGPTRVHPQRFYHWEGTHPKEIDPWGDKAIDALLSAGVRKMKSSTQEDGVLIEERISEWLQKMELADSFQLIPTGSLEDKNYEVRIQKASNSTEVTLADMGHGVSDLFPLLVHCYYAPEGSTLILEQPGIHLHPKAQADLADLLIEVITERDLQILVESHSEHLLTRLQLRTAESKIPASDTALYFCENENGVSTIKPLDIDKIGNIKNWPKNFFGNVRGDLVKMTKEQVKRQKKAEG